MEKKNEIDRACFKKTCDAIFLMAAGKASQIIERLDLNNLDEKTRMGRVYLEIVRTDEELIQLNRHFYAMYYKDPDYLFSIFENTGRLNCAEEFKILEWIITLKEVYNCLLSIKMEMEIKQQVYDFFVRLDHQGAEDGKDQDKDGLFMAGLDVSFAGGTLAPSGEQGKKLRITGLNKEQTIALITIMLNLRIGFLKNPSCLRQFVQWVMDPHKVRTEPPIPIGCMTTEFKYVIEKFKFFNPELSNALVGRDCLFISNLGSTISASNMGSTSFENINKRFGIDYIFALFM